MTDKLGISVVFCLLLITFGFSECRSDAGILKLGRLLPSYIKYGHYYVRNMLEKARKENPAGSNGFMEYYMTGNRGIFR